MGKRHQIYLPDNRIYSCSTCHSHLLSHSSVVSRAFQGRHGSAYLVGHVVNVAIGVKEERMLLTGMHTVADISCSVCGTRIGWKYLHALEESQKYKESKYIVEKAKIAKEVIWDS
ncbi:Yippee/Mis18 [Zychaea mexicana]|uniref:Yippee/Mis18 n=1 Tax=Zychaea mexicana TaxID=64656 RepID=UPI0022FEAA9F|nr:Yippee/Mis18 [Zychaea mexicana]KAI9494544.1 Yippee/Mis18 [Zychaea mexicana]